MAEREAGVAPDETLHEGVPPWLQRPLLGWLERVMRSGGDDISRRVLSQFWLSLDEISRAVQPVFTEREALVVLFDGLLRGVVRPGELERIQALDLINAVAKLGPEEVLEVNWQVEFLDLEQRLHDAGSAWRADAEGRCLLRRVDPVVAGAGDAAKAAAVRAGRPTAAQHLTDAWRRVYGRTPDPTGAYSSAVLAVEAAACPVLLDKAAQDGTATIHSGLRRIEQAPHKWAFTLVDQRGAAAGTGSIEPVRVLLVRLLRGETGRHDADGAGTHNRPSTELEAEVALHAATTLVHWFSTGAVRLV